MVIRTYRSIELINPEAYPLLISAGIFWQKVKKFKKSLKYLEKASEKTDFSYIFLTFLFLKIGVNYLKAEHLLK